MNLGFFGGTFDPIHEGHLVLAREARKQFKLQKVLFIPAFIPPHKTSRRDLTPAPYRYRMVELALRDEPCFEISDVELSRPDVSYTVDTLRALKKKYPEGQLFFIMGSDTLAEIPFWREPEEIRKRVLFLVAERKGALPPPPWASSEVRWIRMPEIPIASSEIRKQIREGKTLGPDVLPPAVEQYISRMKLYRKGRSCNLL